MTKRWLWILITAAAAASPAAGQVCNGLPFRGQRMVAASYLTGDAADSPYSLRELGATGVYQLPGWSPFGTHQLLRVEAAGGRASLEGPGPTAGTLVQVRGNGGMLGLSYTIDVLPSSYAGDYAICVSAGLQRQWWWVSGSSGGGMILPVWLSFGAPLRAGPTGLFPHAALGAYARDVAGDSQQGRVESHGVRPWGDVGLGFFLGPARIDAALHHEFRTRQRAVITFALPM